MSTPTERIKKYRDKHFWFRPLEYAKRRCTDKNHKSYPSYGGRGVICTLTYAEAKILYERDNGYLLNRPSLDRKDPDGHYCFENCRYIEHADNVAAGRTRGSAKDLNGSDPNKGEWEE